MHLLITRPEPGASKTAKRLVELGHTSVVQCLSHIEPTNAPFTKDDYSSVVATSAAAFRFVDLLNQNSLMGLPVYVVGDATATAARDAGFTSVISASGAARQLLELLLKTNAGEQKPLLYLCGENRSFDLTAALAENDRQCVEFEIYRAPLVNKMPNAVVAALQSNEFDGVMFYSERAARHFAQLCRFHNINLEQFGGRIFTMSETICKALPAEIRHLCHAAETPTETAMLTLLELN